MGMTPDRSTPTAGHPGTANHASTMMHEEARQTSGNFLGRAKLHFGSGGCSP
jgi:hypothetical protein